MRSTARNRKRKGEKIKKKRSRIDRRYSLRNKEMENRIIKNIKDEKRRKRALDVRTSGFFEEMVKEVGCLSHQVKKREIE